MIQSAFNNMITQLAAIKKLQGVEEGAKMTEELKQLKQWSSISKKDIDKDIEKAMADTSATEFKIPTIADRLKELKEFKQWKSVKDIDKDIEKAMARHNGRQPLNNMPQTNAEAAPMAADRLADAYQKPENTLDKHGILNSIVPDSIEKRMGGK